MAGTMPDCARTGADVLLRSSRLSSVRVHESDGSALGCHMALAAEREGGRLFFCSTGLNPRPEIYS